MSPLDKALIPSSPMLLQPVKSNSSKLKQCDNTGQNPALTDSWFIRAPSNIFKVCWQVLSKSLSPYELIPTSPLTNNLLIGKSLSLK